MFLDGLLHFVCYIIAAIFVYIIYSHCGFDITVLFLLAYIITQLTLKGDK